MKKYIIALLFATATMMAGAQIPALRQMGHSTVLKVDGKPFVMYCGELHNSTASSISYMQENKVFDQLQSLNMNAVIATVSWEQFEPVEGKYDYTHTDWLIAEAERHHMKLVLIWFGTWKNPMMTYAPAWVKRNPTRFARARNPKGDELEMLSVYSPNILKADTKAYTTWLRHIKEVDSKHTVVMIQLQNEPGLQMTDRDYSDDAQKAWKTQVPKAVTKYLLANKGKLQPDLERVWKAHGYTTTGNWEAVFGKSDSNNKVDNPIINMTEHLFTAYGYANYLEQMAGAGKEVYPLPVFTNASVFGVDSRGISIGNGCSIPEFFDIYRAVSPSLDILAPNAYMPQLEWLAKNYTWKGNPLLIPESAIAPARALYYIGEHDAIAYSPFGIDLTPDEVLTPKKQKQRSMLAETYAALQSMDAMITSRLGSDEMRGIYICNGHESDSLRMGNYQLTFSPKKSFDIDIIMAAASGETPEKKEEKTGTELGGALVIQSASDEFYVVGYGFNADIRYVGKNARFSGYDSIYEGRFENGKFIPGRLLNGDERNVYADYEHVRVFKVSMYHY